MNVLKCSSPNYDLQCSPPVSKCQVAPEHLLFIYVDTSVFDLAFVIRSSAICSVQSHNVQSHKFEKY